MDDLKNMAAHCGIEESQQAELSVGGFIGVLNLSKNVEDATVDKIVDALDAKEFVDEYQKVAFRKGIPKHLPVVMVLKPSPGPPPIMVARAVAKGITRKRCDDKDAMHTQDCFKVLKGKKIKEEALEKFMLTFIEYIGETMDGLDISNVLCLPSKQ